MLLLGAPSGNGTQDSLLLKAGTLTSKTME